MLFVTPRKCHKPALKKTMKSILQKRSDINPWEIDRISTMSIWYWRKSHKNYIHFNLILCIDFYILSNYKMLKRNAFNQTQNRFCIVTFLPLFIFSWGLIKNFRFVVMLAGIQKLITMVLKSKSMNTQFLVFKVSLVVLMP